jgi:hypothetical protein
MTSPNDDEILEEILVPCVVCEILFHPDELIDDICPECREMMEAEMDLEDEEMT